MKIPYEDLVDTLHWLHDEMGAPDDLTDSDIVHLFAEALIAMRDPYCTTCGVNTMKIGEYYSVLKDIWERYGVGRGMLCIGCLEERLGRELASADFSDAIINTPDFGTQSERLQARLQSSSR